MTLKEAASRLNVPESTLRLYRDEFEALLPIHGEGRRRRLEGGGVELLALIVAGKRQGWGADRIRDELRRRRAPEAQKRHRSLAETLEEVLVQVSALRADLSELQAGVAQARREVARLRQELALDSAPAFEDALAPSQ